MRYWTSFNSEIIEKNLKEVAEARHPVTIWQEYGDTKQRAFCYITALSASQVSVRPTDESAQRGIRFTKEKPLFFMSEQVEVAFKKELFSLEGDLITFALPYEMRMKDRRQLERFSYKYQDHKETRLESPYQRVEQDGTPIFRQRLTMVDISTAGLGLAVDAGEAENLTVGSEVFVTKISDQSLPEKHLAEVIHRGPYKIKHVEDKQVSRLGLRFRQHLDSVNYRSISQIIAKKQQKMKGLDIETFHGLDPVDQERKLREVARKNQTLAASLRDNIEFLDRLRYLTVQMKQKFLLEVNHDLLATSLRMASKELIFELMSELTDNMRVEFLRKLDVPKAASGIDKAQDQIIAFIRQKEGQGELVLDPTAYVTYV